MFCKLEIIGSGGREHAICESLKKSNKISKIYCIPGNAGTNLIAENINLDIDNFQKLKKFVIDNKIEIVVVGPERPLVNGIEDFFKENNIKVFGPNKIASQLEGSKIFTKQLCKKFNIPTAKFGIFENNLSAKEFLKNSNYPIVVKADNLASGKGVYICNNYTEADLAVEEIFGGKFGIAKNILIEEFLIGEEMSFFTIHDGKVFKNFGTAQDHKRVLEGDQGKNTGGMGAYSPSRLIDDKLEKKIIDKIIRPTIKGLSEIGCEYKGFLYTGLMIVKNEPYLIEYNVRMGDPECQTILPKLKTDVVDVFLACCEKKLDRIELEWSDKKSLCIVICSKGYPETFSKNVLIENLDKINLNKDEFLFHAGTSSNNNNKFMLQGKSLNFNSQLNFLKQEKILQYKR